MVDWYIFGYSLKSLNLFQKTNSQRKISKSKQYFLTGFILEFQENVYKQVGKIHMFGAGSAGAKKVCFEDLSIDIFLEVQNETCS